jgi:hypothetical protein
MNFRGMKRLGLGLPNDPYPIKTSTFQLDISYHTRIVLMSRALGSAIKMPRANGSGCQLQLTVGIVPTTTPFYVISTNPSTDIFAGSIGVNLDASTAETFMTVAGASASNTITINGTTTGGVTIGDTIFLEDIQAGVWMVTGSIIGSGSVATPFSKV